MVFFVRRTKLCRICHVSIYSPVVLLLPVSRVRLCQRPGGIKTLICSSCDIKIRTHLGLFHFWFFMTHQHSLVSSLIRSAPCLWAGSHRCPTPGRTSALIITGWRRRFIFPGWWLLIIKYLNNDSGHCHHRAPPVDQILANDVIMPLAQCHACSPYWWGHLDW